MVSDTYHEPIAPLSADTCGMRRAIVSPMEKKERA